MNFILASNLNNAIGLNNALIYHFNRDMRFFYEKTKGSIVIMGRKTFESIGSALNGRLNVVLTKKYDFRARGVMVFHGKNEVLDFLKNSDKKVFVIGGKKIYDLFYDDCKRIYLTKIYDRKTGDSYVKDYLKDENFHISNESEFYEEQSIKFKFYELERKNVRN